MRRCAVSVEFLDVVTQLAARAYGTYADGAERLGSLAMMSGSTIAEVDLKIYEAEEDDIRRRRRGKR
jgi:hypothetical protein